MLEFVLFLFVVGFVFAAGMVADSLDGLRAVANAINDLASAVREVEKGLSNLAETYDRNQ